MCVCGGGAVFTEFGIGRRYSSLWASCLLTIDDSAQRRAWCIVYNFVIRQSPQGSKLVIPSHRASWPQSSKRHVSSLSSETFHHLQLVFFFQHSFGNNCRCRSAPAAVHDFVAFFAFRTGLNGVFVSIKYTIFIRLCAITHVRLAALFGNVFDAIFE